MSDPWRIISLDPGGTTGVCEAQDSNEYGWQWKRYSLGEKDHHLTLWNALETFRPHYVICERFVYQRRDPTQGVSLELISRNYIGVAELYCQMYRKTVYPIVMQNVSDAKRMWSDQNLKTLGLWCPVEHERDATRHALLFITKNFKDMTFVEAAKRPES